MLNRAVSATMAFFSLVFLISSCNIQSKKSSGASGPQAGAQGSAILPDAGATYCRKPTNNGTTCPPKPTVTATATTTPGKPGVDPGKPVIDPSSGKPTGPGNAQAANTTPTPGTGKTNFCQDASATFVSLVQPAISGACIGCHNQQKIGLTVLSASNTDANRQTLWDYSGGNAQVLFDKISQSGKSHGGGNRSGDLPLPNISNWIQKEYLCRSNP